MESRLGQYAAIASALLGVNGLNAQILYRNVHPDLLLAEPLPNAINFAELDLNQDGIQDVRLEARHDYSGGVTTNTYTTSMGGTFTYTGNWFLYRWKKYRVMGLNGSKIRIDTANNRPLAAEFAEGDSINQQVSIGTDWGQAAELFFTGSSFINGNIVTSTGGHWPQNGTFSLAAIKIPSSGNNHLYGWMRISIFQDMVLADYAVNVFANMGLAAGQTYWPPPPPPPPGPLPFNLAVSQPLGYNSQYLNPDGSAVPYNKTTESGSNIWLAQNQLHLHLAYPEKPFQLQVFNLKGQCLINEVYPNQGAAPIWFQDWPSGLYSVVLRQNEKTEVFKIWLSP